MKLRRYTFMLSNNCELFLDTEMTYEQLKEYVISKPFIVLYNTGSRPYGNNGWERVPEQIEVKTSSIVWCKEIENYHEEKKKNDEELKKRRELIEQIREYKFGFCHQLKLNSLDTYWDVNDLEKKILHINSKHMESVLEYCVKNNLKKKKEKK